MNDVNFSTQGGCIGINFVTRVRHAGLIIV